MAVEWKDSGNRRPVIPPASRSTSRHHCIVMTISVMTGTADALPPSQLTTPIATVISVNETYIGHGDTGT